MKKYDPKKIEPKWQKYWEKNKTFEAGEDKTREKFYGLIEFPYPSGEGLHVGHPRPFTAMDVISRKKRMEGKNVLFPIGFDAFGLPTENFAIKTGKAPAEVTKKNIANFTRQLKMLGFSFDWSRQVDTTDPNYYRWTQWLFLQFYKHGLAYKKNQPINWCPKDKIGLANEEVVGGCCERCGTPVESRNKEQWMLAITKYAEKLLAGLKDVDYIERARVQQENWIGRSEGARVAFEIKSQSEPTFYQFSEPGAIKDGEPFTERDTIVAIVKHWKEDKYLGLKWKKVAWETFITGGVEPGQTPEEAAKREIYEETGYKNIHFVKKIGKIHSKFFHVPKKQNMFIHPEVLYFELENGDRDEVSKEEKGNHETVWLTDEETGRFALPAAHRYAWDAFKNNNTSNNNSVSVFTTRPDTLFGATYLVLSPEHQLVSRFIHQAENAKEIDAYIIAAKQKTDIDRTAEGKEKTGIELKGVKAINPATQQEIPIWVADYVLAQYGTGAIMGVPAHDERDFDFAKKFGLPIKKVVAPFVKLTGICEPQQGKPTTKKNVVTAIIKNNKNEYLLLDWTNNGCGMVGGGVEEGETPEQAMLREIKEETGYTNVRLNRVVLPDLYAHGYKPRKDVNCFDHDVVFLAELIDEERASDHEVVQGEHTMKWVPAKQVAKHVTQDHHRFIWDYYYQEKPKYLIFDFDGVIGDTLEDGVKINMLLDSVPEEEARKNIDEYFSRKPDHAKGHNLNGDQLEKRVGWIQRYGEEMLKLNPPLFEGFIEAIKNIPNAKIAVISAGSGVYIKNRMPDTGLNPTHILTYEDHHSKEEKIEQVCKDWGISMQDVYYFTDTKADVYELEDCLDRKKLIGCAWGHAGYEGLRELLPADQVLKNFTDIYNLFEDKPLTEDGVAINSDFLNGLKTAEAKEKMIAWLQEKGVGKKQVNYKLRDWVFSRQRYWGEPIPLVYCENCKNKKQKYIIVHGWRSTSQRAFKAWLKVELEKLGHEVWNPDLPNSDEPKLEEQAQFILDNAPFTIDENTVLVGHSLGGPVLYTLLQKIKKPVAKVVLVDPVVKPEFNDESRPSLTASSNWKFNWDKIKNNAQQFVILGDKNFPIIKEEHLRELASALECGLSLVNPSVPHFSSPEKKDGSITVEPSVFEVCVDTGWIPLPESELPLKLPKVEKYQPTDTGESPLAAMEKWVKTKCPQCGGAARRETDTMPNWAGSSWYFLAYALGGESRLAASGDAFWDEKLLKEWMPVDWYNGGMEHTVLHLLYSRFWNIFLHDLGLVPTSEPYKKRTSHGMILAKGGEKMSKSKGNVVNPDEMVEKFGADALRTYIMFMGPFDQAVEWDTNGLVGVRRFLEKVWSLKERLVVIPTTRSLRSVQAPEESLSQSTDRQRSLGGVDPTRDDSKVTTLLHQTIKKVTEDIEGMRFNTAIAKMMELVNEISKHNTISNAQFAALIKILSPFAPHMCEELWSQLGNTQSIALAPWPTYDEGLTKESEITLAVQVNGKLRETITVPADISEEEARKIVLASETVQKWLEGKEPKKIIYVKGKLVSIVV